MPTQLKIDADLDFSVDIDGVRLTAGRLTGTGQELELRVQDPKAFAGGQDAAGIREMARTLSDNGLSLHVTDEVGNRLVSLGAVDTSWWQRRLTKSRHMRIGGLRGGVTAARGRLSRPEGVLPDQELKPPGTLFPLAPTFQRRPRRSLTTTHQQGGSPRLVVSTTPFGQAAKAMGSAANSVTSVRSPRVLPAQKSRSRRGPDPSELRAWRRPGQPTWRSSPKVSPSTSARQDASITLFPTPTVAQEDSPSLVSISTLVVASVP